MFLSSENSNLNFDTRFIKYCLIEGEEGVDISSTAITSDNCNPKSISTTTSFNKLLRTSKENLTTTTGKNSMYYRLKIWLSNKYGDILIPNDVIGKMPTYRRFCEEHNLFTKNGRLSMTAENLYRFIINDPTFKEKHTALEDVLIEKEILAYCFKQHKKMRRKLWE